MYLPVLFGTSRESVGMYNPDDEESAEEELRYNGNCIDFRHQVTVKQIEFLLFLSTAL